MDKTPVDTADTRRAASRAKRGHLRRIHSIVNRIAIITTALALTLGAVTTWAAVSTKTIIFNENGISRQVNTNASTVEEMLSQQGIVLNAKDRLTPAKDAALRTGTKVIYASGRELTVVVDKQEKKLWSTALSLIEVVKEQGLLGKEVRFIAAANTDNEAVDLPAPAPGAKVTVVYDGKQTAVPCAIADTALTLLEKGRVKFGGLDRIETAVNSTGQAVVRVVRIAKKVESVEEEIPPPVEEVDDANLVKGTKKTTSPGKPGRKRITREVTIQDGQVMQVKVLREEVVAQPEAQKVAVGTKPDTAPEGVWAALAACECGGNPRCNTGNGFYGMYQFTLSTWRSVGGTGLPSEASAAEQTKRAQILQKRSGWGQWPACSARLGLY